MLKLRCEKKERIWLKILFLLVAAIFFVALLIPINTALAISTVSWDFPDHCFYDSNVSPYLTPSSVHFTVDDPILAGDGVSDHINVIVNSTSFPAGIPMTLTEQADTGTFINTGLIFTNGTGQFAIGSSQTVGISDPSLNLDPNALDQVI